MVGFRNTDTSGRTTGLLLRCVLYSLVALGLIIVDKRYDHLGRIRRALSIVAYPVQIAVASPFEGWDWFRESVTTRDALRADKTRLEGELRMAQFRLQRYEALEAESQRLRGLREIPHIEIIRIGSRVPVFLPQRIDDELCAMLEQYHPLWINLHFNHPNEITPEVSRAVDKLTKAGLPVGNQSVLLAGVNDCVHIQRALVHKLVANRIRPYYLYQCDLVEGSGHFRTPVGKGLEIMEGLRGHTSGYAVPTFVIDAPGGGGKIPVMPNYLISYSDHKVVLRNYEGYITTYEEPETYQKHDQASCQYCQHERPEAGQSGILGLLEGERMWIEPKGFSETHTRGNTEAHRLQDPSKWVPFGVGAIEGTSSAGLPVLEAGDTESNGAKPVYAPGEEPRPREGEPTASAHGELL
jgi:hypothetical protein